MPGKINSLKKAVENAPNSIISRYLLAKAYILDNTLDEARVLLEQIVFEMPDEYKSTMEYARLLLLEGGSIAQSISTLHQSTLYGFSDPRFVSMLGGLLYLCCRFDESEKVFAETTKRQFSNVNITYFRPHDCGIPGEYDATVRYVGVGYSLVSTDTFTNVRCGSSKYNDILFRVGTQLKVSIEFTARQPVARIIDIIKP